MSWEACKPYICASPLPLPPLRVRFTRPTPTHPLIPSSFDPTARVVLYIHITVHREHFCRARASEASLDGAVAGCHRLSNPRRAVHELSDKEALSVDVPVLPVLELLFKQGAYSGTGEAHPGVWGRDVSRPKIVVLHKRRSVFGFRPPLVSTPPWVPPPGPPVLARVSRPSASVRFVLPGFVFPGGV